MSKLILDSLEIRNFRGLKEMKIEKLGRVNLIVGKNNVGKTSVLEALRVYSKPASPKLLLEIFSRRDEFDKNSPTAGVRSPATLSDILRQKPLPVQYLFTGRHPNEGECSEDVISIGTSGVSEKTLYISRSNFFTDDKNNRERHALWFKLGSKIDSIDLAGISNYFNESIIFLDHHRIPCIFSGAGGLDPHDVEYYWDKIALTHFEEYVSDAVRLVAPEIVKVGLKGIDENSMLRVPFASIQDTDFPVPLKSLGDGLNRLFSISLGLVNAREGLFLIDEVENGIHHSVMPDTWKLIFTLASKLNVQVFATTHSYECIAAFQEAAKESEEEGILIGLARKKGRLFVGEYSETELGIAVEGNIEVRG